MQAYPRSAAVTTCLGVGLILRDLHFSQFPNGPADEESSTGDASSHVAQSVLNWGHYQALLLACRDACEDIEICLEINSGDTAAKPPSTIQDAPMGTLSSIKERDEVPMNQESFWGWEMQGMIQFDIEKLYLNH